MRLIFSDEAGIGEAAIEPVTVVAAVIVHADEHWGPISADVQGILDANIPKDRRASFEFKAARLFARRPADVLAEFVSIIPRYGIPVVVGAVDRGSLRGNLRNLAQRFHDGPEPMPALDALLPPGYNMAAIAQDVAFTVCAVGVELAFRALFPSERGIWIADETRTGVHLKTSLRKWQQEALSFPGAESLPSVQFDHIIDTVYFGKSHESYGIQLADACNFIVKRHLSGDSAVQPLYEIIKPCLVGGAPRVAVVPPGLE